MQSPFANICISLISFILIRDELYAPQLVRSYSYVRPYAKYYIRSYIMYFTRS